MHRALRLALYSPPETRGDCIDGTANTGCRDDRQAGKVRCRAYQCRHNLDVVHSEDVPGRRHNGLAPPWTLNGATDPTSPSCSLDVVDANPAGLSSGEVARIVGLTKRRVEQIVKAWRESEGAVRVMEVGK